MFATAAGNLRSGVAQEFNIPTVYDDWQTLINAGDTDAVVIGTWPYMHYRLTLAALAADKHVMCEARMAMNAAEAHRMREAARNKPHLVAQIVPSPFSLRVDATIKRLLAEGYLGDVLAVNIQARGGDFLDSAAPLHWRHDFDLSGLNIMSLGIWYEAMLRWVGEATEVMALGKTFVKSRLDSDGQWRAVRIPEHVDVIATLACGGQAHIQVSTVTGLDASTDATLHGSRGTLRFAGGKLYGGQQGDEALAEIDIPPAEESSWRVEEEFANAIRGLESIKLTDFETGVKYMEFTEAVARSLATRQAIALPLGSGIK